MPRTPQRPTSIRLPPGLKQELQALARQNQRSLHWTLLEIIRQWLALRRKTRKL